MRLKEIAIVALLCFPALAQHGSTTAVNPYTSPEHEKAGAKLFRGQCAGCHGSDGTGTGAGPNLAAGNFTHGSTDEALFSAISKGLPGTTMPAWPLKPVEVWELVAHIRAIGMAAGVGQVKGDLRSGAAIFRAKCSSCHAATGEGGLTGPDLTDIGATRSYAKIRQSIDDPDAEVASQYWSIEAATNAGATVRGVRLNEDTFSLQIRDEQGRLLSLSKSNLKEIRLVRRSPMPSFAGTLSDTQKSDVIAWLISLGKAQ